MYCHQCGVKLHEEAEFCHSCGSKVIGNSINAVSEPTQPSAPIQTNEANDGRVEKRGTAFVAIGWVAFGLTFLFCLSPVQLPILFGLLALIMGILIINVRSAAHGVTLTVLAIAGTIISITFGYFIRTMMDYFYYYYW